MAAVRKRDSRKMMAEFEETDKMKKELKQLSEAIAKTLDTELRGLKVKATRCAGNCFRAKENFREALHCERTCLNSIVHMKKFMDSKTEPILSSLHSCLTTVEKVSRGVEMKNVDLQSAINCYETFKAQMMKAQSDIVLEFSYFE